MLTFIGLPGAPSYWVEMLGLIPAFLSDADPRPAREQIDANYQHGGGWRPISGGALEKKTGIFNFPGDPPMKPYAMTMLRKEVILLYEADLVAIVQPNGEFEIARLD